jgi:signal transduction histidine kinase
MHTNSLNYITCLIPGLLAIAATGLFYRNKKVLKTIQKEMGRCRRDGERKEFEKRVAVLEARQKERNRIAADMHDELGSGITAILLACELIRTEKKESSAPEIEKISGSARELLHRMGMLIWTMVSAHDSVDSLASYIRNYAIEFFEHTPISCHFDMPASMSWQALSGDKRRNIFLCVKETFNNVLKHSKADRVYITFRVEKKLIIEIRDNGIGINLSEKNGSGYGLPNIQKRMKSIEGIAWIQNGEGTTVTLELTWEPQKPYRASLQ